MGRGVKETICSTVHTLTVFNVEDRSASRTGCAGISGRLVIRSSRSTGWYSKSSLGLLGLCHNGRVVSVIENVRTARVCHKTGSCELALPSVKVELHSRVTIQTR